MPRPHDIDPREDLPTEPQETPFWSENYMFCAYDARQHAGFYAHLGTLGHDPELWRGTFWALLPDGAIVAGKDYGHGGSSNGPGSAELMFRCDEPLSRWTLYRRGVAFRTTRSEIRRTTLSDRPPVPVDFEVRFDASAPIWGMASTNTAVFHRHYQQAGVVRGLLAVDGQAIELDTMGYRDHSVGPRDVAGLLAHSLLYASFPSGRVIQAFVMRGRGGVTQEAAYTSDGNAIDELVIVSLPNWSGEGDGDPGSFTAELKGRQGPISLHGTTEGVFYCSFASPNEIILGLDAGSSHTSSAIVAGTVFDCEGEQGTGFLEMSYRERE